jgi:hypothetical protein
MYVKIDFSCRLSIIEASLVLEAPSGRIDLQDMTGVPGKIIKSFD